MGKFWSLPTWAIFRMAVPFMSKDHKLKSGVTLSTWHKHQTKLCSDFNVMFWVGSVWCTILIYALAAAV